MKKIFLAFLLMFCIGIQNCVQAVETKIEGIGKVSIYGTDTKNTSKQANTRKKQNKKSNYSENLAIVNEAQQKALKASLCMLIDRTLGVNSSKNPEIQAKFEDLLSQSNTYILDKNFTGELIDDEYIAHAYLIVDETEFRTLLSDLGIALNTQAVRAHSIMVVMDEFFARPSDLTQNVLTKEVTTYKYSYDEKLKDTEKASSSAYAKSNSSGKNAGIYDVKVKSKGNYSSSGAAGYSNDYGRAGAAYNSKGSHNNSLSSKGANYSQYNKSASSGRQSSYGHFVDYGKKENEFFQNIKEYDTLAPKAENLNYTQPALQNAFTTYDIRALDNDVFKSKYFKGQPISSDKLSNSAELVNYVKAARNDAKADFFAIGVSYITDNGKNPNTGLNTCDGNVFVKVYSTADSEVIASGTFTETAAGNSADQARSAVANKIGNELGEVLSKKIQDYWKKRMMYGSEYIVLIKGSFLPYERISINNSLQNTNGVKNVVTRSSDSSKLEFTLNYSGENPVADTIFMKLYSSDLSAKFKNYDYKIDGNQVIFIPLNQKGVQKL